MSQLDCVTRGLNIVFALLLVVITGAHHQSRAGAITFLRKVFGWTDAWSATAEAAVWPHLVQCCYLDPHPYQGELLHVPHPQNSCSRLLKPDTLCLFEYMFLFFPHNTIFSADHLKTEYTEYLWSLFTWVCCPPLIQPLLKCWRLFFPAHFINDPLKIGWGCVANTAPALQLLGQIINK